MSKHGRAEAQHAPQWDRAKAAQPPVQQAAMAKPITLRIHFQKAINATLSGGGQFAGVQGLAQWTLPADKILARDHSGMLIDFDGRAAFIPWANVAWVEILSVDSKSA